MKKIIITILSTIHTISIFSMQLYNVSVNTPSIMVPNKPLLTEEQIELKVSQLSPKETVEMVQRATLFHLEKITKAPKNRHLFTSDTEIEQFKNNYFNITFASLAYILVGLQGTSPRYFKNKPNLEQTRYCVSCLQKMVEKEEYFLFFNTEPMGNIMQGLTGRLKDREDKAEKIEAAYTLMDLSLEH